MIAYFQKAPTAAFPRQVRHPADRVRLLLHRTLTISARAVYVLRLTAPVRTRTHLFLGTQVQPPFKKCSVFAGDGKRALSWLWRLNLSAVVVATSLSHSAQPSHVP
jgi:hypothetical protein